MKKIIILILFLFSFSVESQNQPPEISAVKAEMDSNGRMVLVFKVDDPNDLLWYGQGGFDWCKEVIYNGQVVQDCNRHRFGAGTVENGCNRHVYGSWNYFDYEDNVTVTFFIDYESGYQQNSSHFSSELTLEYSQEELNIGDSYVMDIECNLYDTTIIGDLEWTTSNLRVKKFNDGTEIPNITDNYTFSITDTSALCYYDNDNMDVETYGILYNRYAYLGIHDNDPETENKNLAPEGWRLPNSEDWYQLKNMYGEMEYADIPVQAYGAIKSTGTIEGGDGLWFSPNTGATNSTNFNAHPTGYRNTNGEFVNKGYISPFMLGVVIYTSNYGSLVYNSKSGFPIRLVRDASTASIKDYSNAITIFPNPTTSIVTLQGDKDYDIEVYTLQGKKVMALTGNTIDMSHLSSATYIVNALDKVENEEVSYKVVKN